MRLAVFVNGLDQLFGQGDGCFDFHTVTVLQTMRMVKRRRGIWQGLSKVRDYERGALLSADFWSGLNGLCAGVIRSIRSRVRACQFVPVIVLLIRTSAVS